jgi:hypothetical protein
MMGWLIWSEKNRAETVKETDKALRLHFYFIEISSVYCKENDLWGTENSPPAPYFYKKKKKKFNEKVSFVIIKIYFLFLFKRECWGMVSSPYVLGLVLMIFIDRLWVVTK